MPFTEALFWMGLTVIGTGGYILWDRHLKSLWWSLALMIVGCVGVGYSVYLHSHPKAPNPPAWIFLLILTWAAIGWDLYDRYKTRRVAPRKWPSGDVFTIQKVSAETDPSATYKDKIRMVLTNAVGRDLHVWIPLWESDEVAAQHPFGSRFRLEGPAGWRNRDWVKDANGKDAEYSCLEVKAGFTFDCYIGLLPPTGKSIEERLQTRTPVGTAIFPVRIDGKLYDVPEDL